MRKKEAKILIVDDDRAILAAAKMWLKRFFSEVEMLADPAALHQVVAGKQPDVILLDMNFKRGQDSGREGIYWLKEIKEVAPATQVIMMTAFSHVASAVESIKLGAADFILKPWNNEKLYAAVDAAVETGRKLTKKVTKETARGEEEQGVTVAVSSAMRSLQSQLQKAAETEANVLLLGENGTGKYLLAWQLHRLSGRARGPFVHVDLGTIAPTLFESEMFGYVRGAFTGAVADAVGKLESAGGGTVFLDEIGNLSPGLQAKLLGVLQNKTLSRVGEARTRSLDVRFVCATNANLRQMVAEGTFRQDLLYRINTLELNVPPLRARRDDILPLAEEFIDKYAAKYGNTALVLDEGARLALKEYAWPGNVRELEHMVERLAILHEGTVTAADLHFEAGKQMRDKVRSLNLEEMEVALIKEALESNGGNISMACRELGISRTALYRRMEKYNLQ